MHVLFKFQKISREHEEHIPTQYSVYGLSRSQQWIDHFIVSFLHFIVLNIVIFVFLMVSDYNPKSAINIYIWRLLNPTRFYFILLISICNTNFSVSKQA